jgi:uncharacterized protein YfaS (alpha-2-macroglobulin family)
MSAIAITKDGLVGEGQSEVRSTKDLLIRPVTPRFMIVGDKFNMAAVINNNTAMPSPPMCRWKAPASPSTMGR